MVVRPATHADLPAILDIYNDAVLGLTASYDYQPSTLEQRAAWFAEKLEHGYPVLVAEVESRVVGWGALGPFRGRYGYRFTAEDSIYVAAEMRGRGIGKALLAELVERARAMRLHTLIAGIDSEGEASVHLHEAYGFQHVGRFREVGLKFGRWLDVIFMELRLDGPVHDEVLLSRAYAAFNARDIDAALAALHPDVDWPNAAAGTRLHGRDAVRAYWLDQWRNADPRVEPRRFSADSDGRIVVLVHQTVRDLDGRLLSDGMVRHAYRMSTGLARRMDILAAPCG